MVGSRPNVAELGPTCTKDKKGLAGNDPVRTRLSEGILTLLVAADARSMLTRTSVMALALQVSITDTTT